MPAQPIVVCENCDAVYQRPALEGGSRAECSRCGTVLARRRRTNLEVWFALTVACALVFFIANINPIVELELRGERTHATLLQAIGAAAADGVTPVAILAALCAFVFPLLCIGVEFFILAFLLIANRRPPAMQTVMLALRLTRPWSMTEVFMLGILVAVVKLGKDASVIPGAGLAGFAVLTVLMTFLATFDAEAIWDRAGALRE